MTWGKYKNVRSSVNHTLQLSLGHIHGSVGSAGNATQKPWPEFEFAEQFSESPLHFADQLVEKTRGLGLRPRLLRSAFGQVSLLPRQRQLSTKRIKIGMKIFRLSG